MSDKNVTITIGPVSTRLALTIMDAVPSGVEVRFVGIADAAVDDFKPTEDGAAWERKLSNAERVEQATTNTLRDRLKNVRGKDGYRPERDSATERVWHVVVLADPVGITRKSLLLQSGDSISATSAAIYVLRDKKLIQQIGTKWHPVHRP